MKKQLFFIGACVTSFFTLNAQGSYTGFNVTYGFPVSCQVIGNISTENLVANTSSYENVTGSFGAGFNAGSYFGYMFNENMGFDIGVNYLWGSSYTYSDKTESGGGFSDYVENEVSASSFRVSPAFRIGFGEGKLRPYLRGGMTFGLFNKLVNNETGTNVNASGTDISIKKFEMTQGTSIGFMGALGANYSVSESIFIYAEITNYLISWAPEKGELVTATFNGTNVLSSMDIAQKQYEYVNKLESTGSYVANAPTVALKNYLPMSSFGISIGMHFAFGK